MSHYLNALTPFALYKSETLRPYFVDKSMLLKQLFPLVREANNYICITRPRRFGKTVMANMIASFFGIGADSGDIFDSLKISRETGYQENRNHFHVIAISFNELPRRCTSYEQYISRIERRLLEDLQRAYPNCGIDPEEAVWDALTRIFSAAGERKFLFVLDEWDFIFHRDFVAEPDKKEYLLFLSNLLKDKPYVSLAYMTGILPVAKYSSGSELNMFLEYTMGGEERFGSFFGFTEAEVDELFLRFQSREKEPQVTREGLRQWYDGYHTGQGERVYNPRSVVTALMNNHMGNYWTSSGPYDEIYYYVRHNIAEVRKDLALMAAGESVPARIRQYAATGMTLQTRDEIFSAMVVYGFLSYKSGRVAIPNRELMEQFADMLQKEKSLGYLYRLARHSERMLEATLSGDTKTMEEILAYAHDTETPLLSYNSETELTAVVNLVYLAARDLYDIQREDKAGEGFADFIFYPRTGESRPGIILELKVDHTPKEALKQIREKKYMLRFRGKTAEIPSVDEVLAVGIGYDRKTKQHRCAVEKWKVSDEYKEEL